MAKKKQPIKKRVSVKQDPVFLSFPFQNYRRGKIDLLNTEVKLLECSKTLDRIKELRIEKGKLRTHLGKILFELDKKYNLAQDLLPELNQTYRVPRVEKKLEFSINYTEGNSSLNVSKTISKTDELDEELREIQQKLLALNSA